MNIKSANTNWNERLCRSGSDMQWALGVNTTKVTATLSHNGDFEWNIRPIKEKFSDIYIIEENV